MGIKGLDNFLDKSNLQRKEVINAPNNKQNIIVWDSSDYLDRMYQSYRREVSLLFDFYPLFAECKKMKQGFERYGFKLIVFQDGYYIAEKTRTIAQRQNKKFKEKQKKLKIIRKMHQTTDKAKRKKLERDFRFVVSAGYAEYCVQALTAAGFTVHRGSGKSDIDHDIAQFILMNQRKIYGVMSTDTDFFGFDLPQHVKWINKWNFSRNALAFSYYRPCDAMIPQLNVSCVTAMIDECFW